MVVQYCRSCTSRNFCLFLILQFTIVSALTTTTKTATVARLPWKRELTTMPFLGTSVLLSATSSPNNNNKDDTMLNFMEESMDNMVGDDNNNSIDGVEDDDELIDLVHTIVRAADGRKAENIVSLCVRPITTLCSYMIILSGNSRPQNQAISQAIRKEVAEHFDNRRPVGSGVPEGSAESGWMLLDYGNVMVHIMTPKSRLYYNVEGQWREKGAKEYDISNLIIPNSLPGMNADSISSTSGTDSIIEPDEEDPFWS